MGYTQQDLAHHADVSLSTVQNIEAGKNARAASLRRIALALSTDVATLRSGEASPTPAHEPPNHAPEFSPETQAILDMLEDIKQRVTERDRAGDEDTDRRTG